MTSESKWNPSIHDNTHLSTRDLLEWMPKSLNLTKNAYYDLFGNIKPGLFSTNTALTDNSLIDSDILEDA